MSSQAMTLLGAFAAMLAFLSAGLPPETPVYAKLLLGGVNAFVSAYLGLTNRGTTPPPEQKIRLTVTDQPPSPPSHEVTR